MSLSHRSLVSDRHYSGTEEQVEREEEGTYVINRQNLSDLTVTYGLSRRVSLSFGLPFVNASWSIPLPIRPVPGPRSEQNASGFGDVSVTCRAWMFDTGQASRNLSFGVGVKAPTGNARIVDEYPDLTGRTPALKPVDQSIQPGDGGWGFVLELSGFQRLGKAVLFGSFTYLANPRNTNDTPSIRFSMLLVGRLIEMPLTCTTASFAWTAAQARWPGTWTGCTGTATGWRFPAAPSTPGP